MSKIFISYRREDTAAHAHSLDQDLTREFGDERVFRDIADIQPGEDFEEVIRDALQDTSVALVLIGKQWTSVADREGRRRLEDPEDFVAMEVETALKQVPYVIPVLVDGAPMPAKGQLPGRIRELARKNAVRLDLDRWDYDVEKLKGQVRQDLIAERQRLLPRRRMAVLAGLAVTVSTLVSFVAWWMSLFDALPYASSIQSGYVEWLGRFGRAEIAEGRLALIQDNERPEETVDSAAFRRRRHAELLRALTDASAAVVVFDYYFEEASSSDSEFLESILQAQSQGVAVVTGTRSHQNGVPDLTESLRPALGENAGLVRLRLGPVAPLMATVQLGTFKQNPDLVSPVEVLPSLSVVALMRSLGAHRAFFSRDTGSLKLKDQSETLLSIPVRPDLTLNIVFVAGRDLENYSYSYSRILEAHRERDEDYLKRRFGGKIVLVGSADDRTQPDQLGFLGYQIHAQVISSILGGHYAKSPGAGENALLFLASALVGALWQVLLVRRLYRTFRSRLPGWSQSIFPILGGTLAVGVLLLLAALVRFKLFLVVSPVAFYVVAFFLAAFFLSRLQRLDLIRRP